LDRDGDSRQHLIDALREWAGVFMSTSMGTFLQFAKEQGLSVPQIGVLFHINSRGTCGVSDIGDDTGVTSAAASQMLDRLVQNGLVERREDPDDRRAKQIVLTERGRRVLRGSMEARQRWFAALADVLSPHERDQAIATLQTLVARSGASTSSSKRVPVQPRRNAKEHPDR
jgi:DNA-binding MarR family transcriptional regulator